MKSVRTLVKDIYALFTDNDHEVTEENATTFGHQVGKMVEYRLSNQEYEPTLRMSNLGTPCRRKLWYSINRPEKAEPLDPWTKIKFMFGDLCELFLLFLAREAGHTVQNEQREVNLNGVKGHIDCLVDGELVDVKSASTYGFKKFKENGLREDDPFGYLPQLFGYLEAEQDDPDLLEKNHAHFLAFDKQHGHIALDTYRKDPAKNYAELVNSSREMLAQPEPPDRQYTDVEFQKGGNRKLGVECSYCAFKDHCWPNLRTFLYSTGPVFLTEVRKVPNVIEITPHEKNQ